MWCSSCYYFVSFPFFSGIDRLPGKLELGSLFQLQGPGLSDKYYFMGMIMKKPRLHVLVQGFLQPSGEDGQRQVSILEPVSGQVTCQTSHQMFQRILADLSKTKTRIEMQNLKSISCVVHSYSLCSLGPLLTVTLTKPRKSHKFVLRQPVPAQQSRLIFGRVNSPRKRKPKEKKPAGDPKGPLVKKPRVAKAHDFSQIENELAGKGCSGNLAATNPISPASSESSSSSGVGSGSDSDPSSESGTDSDTDAIAVPDMNVGDLTDEEPLQSASSKREEQEVEQILQSHQDLMRSRGRPLEQAEASEPEMPATRSAQAHQSETAPKKTKLKNTFVGLAKVEVQGSRRPAMCRWCKSKISGGSIRFGYVFHLSKFECWIHAGCIAKYLRDQKADMTQVKQFLEAAKFKEQPPLVGEAIAQLECDLQ